MSELLHIPDLQRAISNAIAIEIKEAVNEATIKAKSELEKKIPEIVSKVALQLSSHVSYETLRNEVVIHVMIEKK
jgi:hypothetical protein